VKLYFVFKRNKYDITHSSTPKAGLLSAIASFFARVPVRIHTFTGQRWATKTGISRNFLIFLDKCIGWLNTEIYADSISQVDFLINEGVFKPNMIKVLHHGSFGGVDFEKFNPGFNQEKSKNIMSTLGLKPKSLILIYVGRINKDKGINELISAFCKLSDSGYNIDLLLLGNFENFLDPLPNNITELIRNHNRIHHLGFCSRPQDYLEVSNVFCLPSYREGFGTSVIEAAAMGLPAICSNIPGLVDAIVDRKTGILINKKNQSDLEAAIKFYIDNPDLLDDMGKNARARALKLFDYKDVTNCLIKEYNKHF
jgi:glycosyltransferase involved in cell wall biosynthesis